MCSKAKVDSAYTNNNKMEFTEIQMAIEMNCFVEFANDDDDTILANEHFNKLIKALGITLDVSSIHQAFYSNGYAGFNGDVNVYFNDSRKDTFILFDLGSESDGYDLIQLIIRFQKAMRNIIKPLARNLYDRTRMDVFYQEGMTLERNSRLLTDLKNYPKRKNISSAEYFQNIEFYQNGRKIDRQIDLTAIYSWPFTKEK